jgi:hypothetical protein
MSSQSILIYDDDPQRAGGWREALAAVLGKEYSVDAMSNPDFGKEIAHLQERRKAARSSPLRVKVDPQTKIDSADVLVIDYDLLGAEGAGYVTGEDAAYLARCYSRCGLIVALNQFGTNPFDLTLRGHPESHADLNLGSDQLNNPGLWGDKREGFRPWVWPLVPRAVEAHAKRVQELRGHLDSGIVEHLGLPGTVIRSLPEWATVFVSASRSLEEVTFSDFALHSGNGFRPKDAALDEESVARVASARLSQWIESFLLPGQDILVDAPHLVHRYASLLDGDPRKVTSWNQTTGFAKPESLGIRYRPLEKYRFSRDNWVSRPTWFWTDLSRDEAIKEVSTPFESTTPSFVFCEDLSRFLDRTTGREFLAGIPTPFVRRFIANRNSKKLGALAAEIREVDYRPRDRLYR